jgi:predicted CDP-diglyceride synthetase/phosphatidate cytidylyltransferase
VAFLIIVVQERRPAVRQGKLAGKEDRADLTPSKTVETPRRWQRDGVGAAAVDHPVPPLAPPRSLVIPSWALGRLVMSAIKRDRGVRLGAHDPRPRRHARPSTRDLRRPIFFHLTRYWFTV